MQNEIVLAERVSQLPVIVSLEIHAKLEQQEIMVEIMKEVWGDMLVDEPVNAAEPEVKLPAPGELLGKILVKVKHATPQSSDDASATLQTMSSNSSTSSSEIGVSPEKKKSKSSKMLDALSRLGVYTKSYHFSNLSQPGKFSNVCHLELTLTWG